MSGAATPFTGEIESRIFTLTDEAGVEHRLTVSVDWHWLVRQQGRKAIDNKTGRSSIVAGAIIVKAVRK